MEIHRHARRHWTETVREKSESDYEVRFLIQHSNVGPILGHRGKIIKRLRRQHPRVFIRVPETTTPERLVDLWSTSKDGVLGLFNHVLDLLRNDLTTRGPVAEDAFEVRLLCNQGQMGAITMAERGTWLSGLANTTNVRFKVYQILAPKSTDRVMELMGTVPNIVQAVDRILNHTFEANRRNFRIRKEPYNPLNWDGRLCKDYGGFSGEEVGTITTQRPSGNGDEGQGQRRAGMTKSQFTVPKSYVGALIGMGGDAIQKIRDDSGAQISISVGEIESDDRIVTISGTPTQVESATTLLQNSAHRAYQEKDGRGPGSTTQ